MTANASIPEEQPLTAKQEALITALLSGLSIVAAARAVGISEKTAHLWLKRPNVQTAYKAAQKRIFDEAMNDLLTGVPEVLKALKRHINAGDVEPTAASQIRSSQIWFEQSISIHKLEELERRIEALENTAKGN